MRAGYLFVLVALVASIGYCASASAPPPLVVTGEELLTPANISPCGYAYIVVKPGATLIIANDSSVPLEVKARDYIAVQGTIRICAVAGPQHSPTGDGGNVFFNVERGRFLVDADGVVDASAVQTRTLHGTRGGTICVAADAARIAGTIRADGDDSTSAGEAGRIEIKACEGITVDGAGTQLAALSATGCKGGIISLWVADGPVLLSESSLLDVRGRYGIPLDANNLSNNASVIDLNARGAKLGGLRLYGVDNKANGIGHCYYQGNGPVEVTAPGSAILSSVASLYHYSDIYPAAATCYALRLVTRSHLGDVQILTDLNCPVEIVASNNVEICGATFGASVSAQVAGYLYAANSEFRGPTTLAASRILLSKVKYGASFAAKETYQPLYFYKETFAPGEVYTTPCALKLSSCTVGDGASITSEGSLEVSGGTICNNASLQAGKAAGIAFAKQLPVVSTMLSLSGVTAGDNVCLSFIRPGYYPASKVPIAKIVGGTYGYALRLYADGPLEMTGMTAKNGLYMEVKGALKFTGGAFGTGTIKYRQGRKVVGTKDQGIKYVQF